MYFSFLDEGKIEIIDIEVDCLLPFIILGEFGLSGDRVLAFRLISHTLGYNSSYKDTLPFALAQSRHFSLVGRRGDYHTSIHNFH
jgi:hypothetical protein